MAKDNEQKPDRQRVAASSGSPLGTPYGAWGWPTFSRVGSEKFVFAHAETKETNTNGK